MVEKIEETQNWDGFIDAMRKLGNKNKGNGFRLTVASDATIAALYTGNGLAKRYIDLVVDDMVRQWITIPEDTDGEILEYLKRIKAKTEFKNALRNSKLFGGSLIYLIIEDGKLPNEPVDENNIKSIKKLRVFSRSKVQVLETNYYKDPTNARFGEPEYFTVQDKQQEYTIHESRCLVFQGEYYPEDELGATVSYDKFWGLSSLQAIHEDLQDYGLAQQSLFSLLIKSNVDTLRIKGLMDKLRSADGKKQLDARLAMHDMAKSVSNTVVIDNEEDFMTVSQQFSGIADTFAKLQDNIAGTTGIPSTILFGTPPKGLSATGDNEVRIYYDKVKSDQEESLLVTLEKLIRYITLAKDGVKMEEVNIEFNSLWQQTEEQKVKMRLEQSKIDEVYIANGVLAPDEVRQSRFGNDTYSIETTIEGEIELPPEEEEENESK